MITEERIKALAYSIWEQEGRPDGKDAEHYYAAKRILEEREAASSPVIQLPPRPALAQLPATPTELPSPPEKPKLPEPHTGKQRRKKRK